jgi:hypothetical protein
MRKFESEDYETFQKDTQIVTYATLGFANNNPIPVTDLFFGAFKNEKEALLGVSEAIKEIFIETFESKIGLSFTEEKLTKALDKFGLSPFDAVKFKNFTQSLEWNEYMATDESFIFFKILPLKDYLEKSFNKNNVIYVPFS